MDTINSATPAEIAERQHDSARDEPTDLEFRSKQQAEFDVCDADIVRELINDYEMDAAECLARCFRNLDRACKGDQISRDAITTALHNLRRDMQEKREEILVNA